MRADIRARLAAKSLDGLDDLGLKLLQRLHRHVKEIACAAGGIENAQGREAGVVGNGGGEGVQVLPGTGRGTVQRS